MMNKIVLTLTGMVPFLLAGFSGQALAFEHPKLTIRAATANPPDSHYAAAIEKFREIVEKDSNGRITVETFYSGSMGDEQTNVKQLRTQELHLTVVAAGNVSPFAPRASLFILPYLFPSVQDAYTLFGAEDFVQRQNDVIAKESGARPVGWLIGGYRVLTNSQRPVKNLADLQGLKIRVPPVELQLDAFRAWGIEPYPLAWTETFNALQQGVADGQENPYGINRDQKFWEVQTYISDLHYMLWVGPILVSEPWYQSLPPQTQDLVRHAAHEAERYEWQWSANDLDKARETCLSHGMQVVELEDEPVWIEKARSIWPKYAEKVGGQAVVDEALAIITAQNAKKSP